MPPSSASPTATSCRSMPRSSVRGSQAGELIARCIVETGTSSYYTALDDATDEPVLKQICRKIAADEFRHYKLFYAHLDRYLERERLGRWAPAAHRLGPHHRERGRRAGLRLLRRQRAGRRGLRPRALHAGLCAARLSALPPPHVQRAMAMVLKAVGLKPQGWLNRLLTRAGLWFLRRNASRLAASGA